MSEGEINDVFINVQMLATLGDADAERVFPALKQRFAGDANALRAVAGFEERWKARRGGA